MKSSRGWQRRGAALEDVWGAEEGTCLKKSSRELSNLRTGL